MVLCPNHTNSDFWKFIITFIHLAHAFIGSNLQKRIRIKHHTRRNLRKNTEETGKSQRVRLVQKWNQVQKGVGQGREVRNNGKCLDRGGGLNYRTSMFCTAY